GLLEELAGDDGDLPQRLSPGGATGADPKHPPGEADFRYALNDDAMATEKLAEGIRNFVADQVTLEKVMAAQ
ncbi:MAG: transaldolase, partial [Halioglobus sp.]